MNRENILVVDDELNILDVVGEILEDEGYLVTKASNATEAREAKSKKKFDLILLDIWMPDIDGISLLNEWASQGNLVPVIMMSGHATIDTAMEATRLGAINFIEKPLSISRLLKVIDNSIKSQVSIKAGIRQTEKLPFDIGKSKILKALKRKLDKVISVNSNILLLGEVGSGRVSIAKQILTSTSVQTDIKIVEISARDIASEDLKNIFSNDRSNHNNLLLIKDLDDVSIDILKEFNDLLNSNTQIRVIITASSLTDIDKNIIEIIRSIGISIEIPSLRSYAEDIPELLMYYVNYYVTSDNLPYKDFSVAAQNRLRNYTWPRNIAELKELIKKLLVITEDDEISLKDVEEEINKTSSNTNLFSSDVLSMSLKEARQDFEKKYLLQQLNLCEGKISKLSERIGVERTHLYRKLKSLGVDYRLKKRK
ncbi:MAG: response regulator [Pseudomonadota bacterium]|nr:hypothetical protein [Gammaproteobacteria bacterium]MEE2684294.1 response regulator [Pseudomonadota bacterium]